MRTSTFHIIVLIVLSACQISGHESRTEAYLKASIQPSASTQHIAWEAIDKNYRSIHVFVALCDNKNQGIVPVPAKLGNGQDPNNNLYWGALYGVKTHLRRSDDWKLVTTVPSANTNILESVLFLHRKEKIYLLAEAYDGAAIKSCTIDMLKALSHQHPLTVSHDSLQLEFGDQSDLIAYVGHNGLMEFDLDLSSKPVENDSKETVILACASSQYFNPYLKAAGADPLLCTTSLMAPEAYVLEAALSTWVQDGTGEEMVESAALAYDSYQQCGIKGARNLFKTGY